MTYDPGRNHHAGHTVPPDGPASDWYALEAAHVGQPDLPTYGRAFEVRFSGAPSTVTLVVVPMRAETEAQRTIVVTGNEIVPRAIRAVVSINGGTAIPPGVTIDIFTR
jgi:hypothetical protein